MQRVQLLHAYPNGAEVSAQFGLGDRALDASPAFGSSNRIAALHGLGVDPELEALRNIGTIAKAVAAGRGRRLDVAYFNAVEPRRATMIVIVGRRSA